MIRRCLKAALLLAMGLILLPALGDTIPLEQAPPEQTDATPTYPWLMLADSPPPQEILTAPPSLYPTSLSTSGSNIYLPEPGAFSLFMLGLLLVLVARVWRARTRSAKKTQSDT